MAADPVAVTGATGFVGSALCAALAGEGREVKALVRSANRAGSLPAGVEPVLGALDEEPALAALVDGAGIVIHAAGIVAAREPDEFDRVNAAGTARLVAAVKSAARSPRILLISSLAARHPRLSAYAASKRAGEEIVAGSGLEHCIVRPPAVYGPGDRATLPLFRQLAGGLLLAPKIEGGRFSLLHVDDLARLLCVLLQQPAWAGETFEPDDGRFGGYGWRDLAAIAGKAQGKTVRCLELPRAVVWCAAVAQELAAAVTGGAAMLSRGKLGELCYPDWVCNRESMGGAAGWAPAVDFAEGFLATLAWYRRRGWIRAGNGQT
ncbi:MAG: NAD(P)-dependent oxidoreductase [Rhodospirillales bacterium]|nr:NAD(P)-dependent oxidoreductase [Rhodospirillales bacterium]